MNWLLKPVHVKLSLARIGGPGSRRAADVKPADLRALTFKVTDHEARCAPAPEPAGVRCPHTGALIFASPDNQPPLTTDAVRELLADFP